MADIDIHKLNNVKSEMEFFEEIYFEEAQVVNPSDFISRVGGFKTSVMAVFTILASFSWGMFERNIASEYG